MQQLVQELKKGEMKILEVPMPELPENGVLVRSHISVISAGTEGKTVSDARKGYLAKAKSRQKEVKQVMQAVKTQGLLATYKLVINKLEAPSGLGYSCAGEVIAVGDKVREFKVGDRVACGGAGALHAEVVAVPKNLCVKVPDGVDLKQAAFATIAAIALQGVRQADLKLGESAAVIGLGLVGQLTLQFLRSAGVYPLAIDLDPNAVALARKVGFKSAFLRTQVGLEEKILRETRGLGVDAAIICASTSSLGPINLAGVLCRKKGKVVVVGGIPTGFDREHYYKKELELRMSSSYGPGRYDPQYEEKGIDYPPAYVRWTENRNMQAFLDLLASKRIDISSLISHEFALDDAPQAYQMILERQQPFCGILIRYDTTRKPEKRIVFREAVAAPAQANVGFIGVGNFALNVLLPCLKKSRANLVGVASSRGNMARFAAEKYGFAYCAAKTDELFKDKNINTIFIATRHHSHTRFVKEALKAGKNVFIEKPLCLTEKELEEISEFFKEKGKSIKEKVKDGQAILKTSDLTPSAVRRMPILMVGFNRRFSPLVEKVKALFPADSPKSILIRINAGAVPADHWIQDPDIGGGRVVGEVCHFVDLAMFIAGSPITSVSASPMASTRNLNDTLVVNLSFVNGSVASISYFSNGSPLLPKERLEVFCAGNIVVINDFKELSVFDKKISKTKLSRQDKGHGREVELFLQAVKKGEPSPIPFNEIYLSTLATFKIIEACKNRTVIHLSGL